MMGRVSLNREPWTEADVTAVSNVFIDDYMADANDAQLKIYLYLLRMMRAGLPTDLNDLADRFNLTENDVTRALKFWEKRGIVSLEYDRKGNLTGLHLDDLSRADREAASAVASKEEETSLSPAAVKPLVPSVQEPVFDEVTSTAAAEEPDSSQILFIAERYVGRPLSVTETETLLYIRDKLAFSDTLLDYLLQYCVERGKKDFHYMERVAVRWRESGYETPEQAKRGTFKYDRRIYEVMDLLGLSENLPTSTEAAFVERWSSDYRMPIDVIREACARTVLATQKRRLEYADRILERWHEAGVTKKSDIRQLDDAHEETKKLHRNRTTDSRAGSAAPIRQAAGRPRNFPQREDYDIAMIEKMLVQN